MCATRAGGDDSIKKDFWYNFEDLPSNRIGYFVKSEQSSAFMVADEKVVNDALGDFFRRAGLPAEQAVGKQVGSTTGMVLISQLPKLIGPSIALARFLLSWKSEVLAQRRREMFPAVGITILADHIDPVAIGPTKVIDSATTLSIILPELCQHLRSELPGLRFQLKIQARGKLIRSVEIRAGRWPVSETDVVKILKYLERDIQKATIMQVEGWFGRPTIARAAYIAPDLSRFKR